MEGILYVVATPIGNLGDITLRAIDILKDADVVVAENRARALALLSHLGLRKHITTINSYNEDRKAQGIVNYLLSGNSCALISGAGTPCISDPGTAVVKKCHEAGIEVKVVPGPSALTGAVSISGLHADRFVFFGFLPLKKGKKKKVLKDLSPFPYPLIFYESPRRLLETLRCIHDELGNRFVVVLKEMTKIHEEVLRGEVGELVTWLETKELKGEFVVIVDSRGKSM